MIDAAQTEQAVKKKKSEAARSTASGTRLRCCSSAPVVSLLIDLSGRVLLRVRARCAYTPSVGQA